MARGPNDNMRKARELYKQGMKLVDIAKELDTTPATIRSWKSRYKWDAEESATLQKRDATQRNATKKAQQKEAVKIEKATEVVDEVMSNDGLNDKQRLFCLYFSKSFNATRSYQKAYGCSYNTAAVEGSRSLRKPNIKEEINRIKRERYTREFISEEDIFQKYMDIAYADVTDFVEFGQKEVEFQDGTTGMVSYVDLKECAEVDGTIITEVSKGKDGVKVKLGDRMKALQWLTDHMDMATAEQRARIKALESKCQDDGDEEEIADDGFMEALNGSAKDDWSEENT